MRSEPRSSPGIPGADETFKALVFDATGIGSSDELRQAYEFFHPVIRSLPAERTGDRPRRRRRRRPATPEASVAQRALEGLVRSIGKEVRKGVTAQLVYVAPNAEDQLASTLRFFLSPKSAYVSGQVVRIGAAVSGAVPSPESGLTIDWERPLEGKVALVTGASRGIGESIASVLARDGAHVVGLDVPAQSSELDAVTRRLGGSSLDARHHRRRCAGHDRLAPAGQARRRRRRDPQRGRHARQDARSDERGPVGHGARHQPDRTAPDRPGAVRPQGGQGQRPGRLASRRSPGSPATRDRRTTRPRRRGSSAWSRPTRPGSPSAA